MEMRPAPFGRHLAPRAWTRPNPAVSFGAMVRARGIAACATLALLLLGCSSLQRAPLSADASRGLSPLDHKTGLEIVAYTTPDGVFHGFQGRARWVSAAHESLELTGKRRAHVDGAEPSGDADDKHPVTIRLARVEVASLLYKGSDPGKSGLLGLGILSSVLAGLVVLYIIGMTAYGD